MLFEVWATIRSVEPWKITSPTVAGRLRPSAAPASPSEIRSGRTINVMGSPLLASPAEVRASRMPLSSTATGSAVPTPSNVPGKRLADPMNPATKMLAGRS